ncbi:MAG TPA: CHAT domain-containing protein [Pyrinomonadaceae bacterium]|jgi:CHAT domain-containing protein/tetratricopeptide (TPR) repeat protein
MGFHVRVQAAGHFIPLPQPFATGVYGFRTTAHSLFKFDESAATPNTGVAIRASFVSQGSTVRPGDERDIRSTVEAFFSFFSKKDLNGVLALWSEKSADLNQFREQTKQRFAAIDTTFANLAFSRVTAEGERARVRVAADRTANDTESRRSRTLHVLYDLTLVKEGGRWLILGVEDAIEKLVAAVIAAQTEDERDALLASDPELVSITFVDTLNRSGQRLFYYGNVQGAITAFTTGHRVGVELHRKNPTPTTRRLVAVMLSSLGVMNSVRGDYAKALEYLEASLAEAKDDDLVASLKQNMGILRALRGNYEAALELFRESLERAKALNDRRQMGQARDGIANVFSLQNKFDDALREYEKNKEMREEALREKTNSNALPADIQKYASDLADTLNNIGIVYHQRWHAMRGRNRDKADLLEANKYYAASMKHVEGRDAIREATTRLNQAELQVLLGDYKAALVSASGAADLGERLGFAEVVWRSWLAKGYALQGQQQQEQARQAFGRAIELVEDLRRQSPGDEVERQKFFEDKVAPFHAMVGLLAAEKNKGEALFYSERAKGRVLLDVLQGGRLLVNKAMTAEEQRQEQEFQRQLDLQDRAVSEAWGGRREGVEFKLLLDRRSKLERDYESFLQRLYEAHPELKVRRGEAQAVRADEVVRLLPDASAVIEFTVTADKTYVFVLTRSRGAASTQRAGDAANLTLYTVDITKEELRDRVARFREMIGRVDPGYKKPAAELFQLLLGRASPQLKDVKTLVVVPDSYLWELPFQALQRPGGHHLLQDFVLLYAPSLTVLREMMNQRPGGDEAMRPTLLALGNPSLDGDVLQRVEAARMDAELEPLPDAEKQVNELRDVVYGHSLSKVYTGPDAREDTFKEEAGRYRILHLATHGILNNAQPMSSYLVLAPPRAPRAQGDDGLLEASELARLNLRADLVVLAACETARGQVGEGEGMVGIAWSLFVAGCPTTVASQWKVRSDSTRLLMLEFHRNVVGDLGTRPSHIRAARALREAALRVFNEKELDYKHPFHWAGFIAIGDGL